MHRLLKEVNMKQDYFDSLDLAFRSAGLIMPNRINMDSRIHRCKTYTKPSHKNGWYFATEFTDSKGDSVEFAIAGNWESDERAYYLSKAKDDSSIDWEEIRAQRERLEQTLQLEQLTAIQAAKDTYTSLEVVSDTFANCDYLKRKGLYYGMLKEISYHPLKLTPSGELIIPIYDESYNITSFQTITSNAKLFAKGGKVSQGFCGYRIPESSAFRGFIFICEGFANAATVYIASEEPDVVICAFSKNNLSYCAHLFSKRFPSARIILVADNDSPVSDQNYGYKACLEIQEELPNVAIYLPKLNGAKKADINDEFVKFGTDYVFNALKLCRENITPPLPDGFLIRDGSLYKVTKKKNEDENLIWLSDAFYVVDSYHINGKLLREISYSIKGVKKTAYIPASAFNGGALGPILANLVLRFNAEKIQSLGRYISATDLPEPRVATLKLGWHSLNATNDCYILPQFSTSESISYFIPESPIGETYLPTYKTSGGLVNWQKTVAKYCYNSPMLEFALCAGFASVIAPLVDCSFGVNFFGPSGSGKTTALKVIASIFGGHGLLATWNATINGLEEMASSLNGVPLLLDEASNISERQLEVIYQLINGRGRLRAKISKRAEVVQAPTKGWSVTVFSSSEVAILDRANRVGRKLRSGEAIRFLDIPFNSTGLNAELVNEVITNSSRFYGTAIEPFIHYLLSLSTSIVNLVERQYKLFLQDLTLHSEQMRALRYFAVIAVAGQLACDAGIIECSLEPADLALQFFHSWSHYRGYRVGIGTEEAKVLDFFQDVRDHPAKYFLNSQDERPNWRMPLLGVFKSDYAGAIEYFLLSSQLREATNSFFDANLSTPQIINLLFANGFLTDNKSKVVRFGSATSRCYQFIMSNT